MICLIDYGSGNVGALMNIFKQRKIPHFLSGRPDEFAKADRFLLPGVGAFDPTMAQLRGSGILDSLEEEVAGKGKPVLGICVGMHLLAEGSDEGELPGLGWIKGRVKKIDPAELSAPPHLPHMGWNNIDVNGSRPLFEGVDRTRGFYFLHSYYFDAAAPETVSASVSYGETLPCGVERDNIYGVQFHPEKSHHNGTRLLQNFAVLGNQVG
jgi:imidazole glycerol-phosphate synthase subunit HisH